MGEDPHDDLRACGATLDGACARRVTSARSVDAGEPTGLGGGRASFAGGARRAG